LSKTTPASFCRVIPASGKIYLGCALAKEACRHLYRTRYIRVLTLLDEFNERSDEAGGREKVLRKYATFKVLVLDEWLIQDLSKKEISFLFELSERRFDNTSTIFCTLYKQEDWIRSLGGGALAESIVERYRHNTIFLETGEINMRSIFNRKNNS
jgi:DNA replication protein DnaC